MTINTNKIRTFEEAVKCMTNHIDHTEEEWARIDRALEAEDEAIAARAAIDEGTPF